jgi:hypothetical protein
MFSNGNLVHRQEQPLAVIGYQLCYPEGYVMVKIVGIWSTDLFCRANSCGAFELWVGQNLFNTDVNTIFDVF